MYEDEIMCEDEDIGVYDMAVYGLEKLGFKGKEIILRYVYENDITVSCTAKFEDNYFKYTYNGVEFKVENYDIIFNYSFCGLYFKSLLGIEEDLLYVRLQVKGFMENEIVEFIAVYVESSLKEERPNFYTGTLVYKCNKLVATVNDIFLHGVFGIMGIRARLLDILESMA